MIESLSSDHPALSCSWARGPEKAATVRIRIDPARIDDVLEAILRVQVSGPHAGSLEIPVRIQRE